MTMTPSEFAEKNFIIPFQELIRNVDNGFGKNPTTKKIVEQLHDYGVKYNCEINKYKYYHDDYSLNNPISDYLRDGRVVFNYIIEYLNSKNWSFLSEKCHIYAELLFLTIRRRYNNDSRWEYTFISLLNRMIEDTTDKNIPFDITKVDRKYLLQLDGNIIIKRLTKRCIDKDKDIFISFVQILLYQQDKRVIPIIRDILSACANHDVFLSSGAQNRILYAILDSNIWKSYYSKKKDMVNAYVIIGSDNIRRKWELLCLEGIKEYYPEKKIRHRKTLPCGTKADIVVFDKKGNIDSIYICKRYIRGYADILGNKKDRIAAYAKYTNKIKVLLLEYPRITMQYAKVEIITSKMLSVKKKLSAQTRESIKNMIKQCRNEKNPAKTEYVIDYSKKPQNELDEVFSFFDFLNKKHIG